MRPKIVGGRRIPRLLVFVLILPDYKIISNAITNGNKMLSCYIAVNKGASWRNTGSHPPQQTQ
jgi:hypothetical protein